VLAEFLCVSVFRHATSDLGRVHAQRHGWVRPLRYQLGQWVQPPYDGRASGWDRSELHNLWRWHDGTVWGFFFFFFFFLNGSSPGCLEKKNWSLKKMMAVAFRGIRHRHWAERRWWFFRASWDLERKNWKLLFFFNKI